MSRVADWPKSGVLRGPLSRALGGEMLAHDRRPPIAASGAFAKISIRDDYLGALVRA
jgi:hypothetical protein